MAIYAPSPDSVTTNPSAVFPVPPPFPNFPVVNEKGFFTPQYMEFIQKMWLAIQGSGGLQQLVYQTIVGDINVNAETQTSIEQHFGGSTIEAKDVSGLIAHLSKEVEDVKKLALLSYGSGVPDSDVDSDASSCGCCDVEAWPIGKVLDSTDGGKIFTNQL